MELIRDALCEQIVSAAERLAQGKDPGKLTVRDILKEMGITNRVFYNRFHSIEEVLAILYARSVSAVRKSLSIPWDGTTGFEEHVRAVAVRTLELTYDSRGNLCRYVFEADSLSSSNFHWWTAEIKKLIAEGEKIGYFREALDEDAVSYSIWCFIRGFAADAIARKLPRETAVNQFAYGFGCFLKGLKA